MSTFEVVLAGDGAPQLVRADAYEQEGPMTTFFTCESSHVRLDSWALRLASFRSADVRMIRRVDADHAARPTLELVAVADPA
jgi:hypothetical protein